MIIMLETQAHLMMIVVEKDYCRSSSKRCLPTNNNIVKSAILITKMELQRGRRVKVPGGMELGSRVLLLLHVIPGLKDRLPCLKESLLFPFDVFSRESTV
jgi:hypothetical protein